MTDDTDDSNHDLTDEEIEQIKADPVLQMSDFIDDDGEQA